MTTATSKRATTCGREIHSAASPKANAFQGRPAGAALLQVVVLDARERRRLARRKHLLLALEANARTPLRGLAEEVRAPISTVFDDMRAIQKQCRFILLPKGTAPPISLDGLPVGWQRAVQRRQQRHARIIAALKKDVRAPLTRLSRQLEIPISTLAEDMRGIEERVHFTIESSEQSAGYGNG